MTTHAEPWQIEGAEPASQQQWRKAVDAVLTRRRGDLSPDDLERLFAKVLTTTTDDGIVLAPLYRAQDAPTWTGLPGQAPFVRGATAAGPVPAGWDVRQRVVATDDPAATNAAVLAELEQGASSVWLDLDGQAPSVALLDAMLSGVHLHMVPIVLAAGPAATDAAAAMLALWQKRGTDADEARGSLGFDPIGRYAASGGVEDAEIGLAAAADVARSATALVPRVTTLVADATGYHDAGASEADEVALALATSTAYLRTLVTAGLDIDSALAHVEIRLSATDNQFLTIAKLRAARRVAARVAEVAGASAAAPAQRQHVVSSRAMLTRYDVWVNLLRTTVAGFAAGVGGADAVTIDPHDRLLRTEQTPPEQAELGTRLARNVQNVLIMESHLARVVDPAGGSWFVESLTDALAQRAWERFTEIEAAGGIVAALAEGLPQSWIDDTRTARADRVAHRTAPITGVSEFPNLSDTAAAPSPAPSGPSPFAPVTPHFYAEGFEVLRDRSAAHESATGARPSVFLATLGPLAEHTARATFTANLFAAGGIAAVTATSVTADSVASAFADSGCALACICGSDARYADEAVAVAQALAAADPAALYMAGNPGDLRADLDAAGVTDYVVSGGDAVALLDRALTEAGVQ